MQTDEERERLRLLEKAQRDLEGLGWQAGHAELIAALAVEVRFLKGRVSELEESLCRAREIQGEFMARVAFLEINSKGGQVHEN